MQDPLNNCERVRYEFFTAMRMDDLLVCCSGSILTVWQHFRWTYCLHRQGWSDNGGGMFTCSPETWHTAKILYRAVNCMIIYNHEDGCLIGCYCRRNWPTFRMWLSPTSSGQSLHFHGHKKQSNVIIIKNKAWKTLRRLLQTQNIHSFILMLYKYFRL